MSIPELSPSPLCTAVIETKTSANKASEDLENGTMATSPCVFPFKHEEVEKNGCIQPSWQDSLIKGSSNPWCPTITNSMGYHNFHHRGYCSKIHCRAVCFKIFAYISEVGSIQPLNSKGIFLFSNYLAFYTFIIS